MHSAPSSYLLYVLQVVFTWPYTVYIFFTPPSQPWGVGVKFANNISSTFTSVVW